MKLKILLRPALTIVFGFIGAFIARGGTPPEVFAVTGEYFIFVAFVSFATLGFILPEIAELAGKAGIAALARQIVKYIPDPRSVSYPTGLNPLPFGRVSKKKLKYVNPILVDTSVLIDGRLLDIARSGFVFGTLIVLPSVVSELHSLSDSADDLKRAKGRRGLDVLAALKKGKVLRAEMVKSEPKAESVDEMLVKAALSYGGKLLTVDFNLNKVANVRSVPVLNINELANALKTAVLPGEVLSIKVSDTGKEKGQGVGYLGDGTMVVVENGASYTGKTVDVKAHRVLQTAAGKMVFAKIAL